MTEINQSLSENTSNSQSENTQSVNEPTPTHMTPAERKKYIQELKAKKEAEKKAELKRQKDEIKKKKKEMSANSGGKSKKKVVIILVLIIVLIGAGVYMYKQNPDMFQKPITKEVVKPAPVKEEPVAETSDVESEEVEGRLPKPSWIISFGAFKSKELAEKNVQKLQNKGFAAGYFWIPDYVPGGTEYFKVYVGPFTSKEEAKAKIEAVHKLSIDAYFQLIQ